MKHIAAGGSSSKVTYIQSRSDSGLAFLLLLIAPAAVYSAIHASAQPEWVHFWSLLLLLSGPLLFATILQKGMWWVGADAATDALRRLVLLASLAVFLAGIEGRVVFYSFGQYIRLAAPWSYVAITIATYGVAALVLLHFSGALGDEAAGALLGPVLMISASVGSLAAGIPMWVLPAPLLSAAGLAMYYETRTLRDYLLFTAGALVTGGWLVWQHFWFLDVVLDGMHLRTLCVLLLVAAGPAFLLPGLVHVRGGRALVSPLLLIQAGLLCVLEEHLYAGDHASVTYNVHPMLPAYMVVATSALGLFMARRLLTDRVIGDVAAYALQCVYGAKLAMLVLPDARMTVPILVVALAVSPPVLLQTDNIHRQRTLLPWQGIGLAAAVVFSVIAARFAVFDILQFLLNRRPSEALAFGVLVLCSAAGCLPLVMRYYSGSAGAKRALVLAITLGMLLVLLRPPLPLRGGAKCPHLPLGLCPRLWNEEHTPDHEEDDVSIYGDGLRRREHWPLWLLAGAAFLGLAAVTSPAPGRQVQPMRLMEAAGSAALVGGYLALEFFPGMRTLQTVILSSAMLAAAVIVLLQIPSKGGAVLLPLMGLAWVGCLPLSLVVQAASPLPPLHADAHRLFPDVEQTEVDTERREALRTAVLATFAAEALLLAFALKLKVAAAAAGQRLPSTSRSFAADSAMIDQAASFLGQCMPAYATQFPGATKLPKGYVNPAAHRLAAEGMGWIPTACNLVTFQCFVLCIFLNIEFTGGEDGAVLLLAPILLLLCQDPLLLRGLTDRQRYFPPALAIILTLTWSACYTMWDIIQEDQGFTSSLHSSKFAMTNVFCLMACAPSNYDLLAHMWSRPRMSVGRALAPAILLLLPILAADIFAIKVLGCVGAAGAAIVGTAAAFRNEAGRKII